MRQENWQQAKEIFYSALHKPAEERELFLAGACQDDPQLKKDVEILLASFQSDYLENPLLDFRAGLSAGRDFPAAARFQTGDELNHYIILRALGSGGMGEVYLAMDQKLDRPVAVKILHKAAGAIAEKRLLREARSAAKLDHPNICAIYEVGETADFPFIAMQFVDGETLDEFLKTNSISSSEYLAFALQIAAALEEAHAHHIIHRDIKPSNIIITPKKQVKVLDFSLAKRVFQEPESRPESRLSEIGAVAGTVAYMSPEQARGQEIDGRSDIWSLGVVLYEMMTGRLPFAGAAKNDVIAAILTARPAPITSSDELFAKRLNQIIERSLQKNREERYASVADLTADLLKLKNDLKPDRAQQIKIGTAENVVPISKEPGPQSTLPNLTETADREETGPPDRPPAAEFQWKRLMAALVIGGILLSGALWRFYAVSQPKASADLTKIQAAPFFSVENKPDGAVYDISFSPDGKYIVFGVTNDGGSSIFVRLAAGDKAVRLTDGTWNDRTPVWSPDGMRIAFLSDRDHRSGVWTIPYLGGTPTLQTEIAGSSELSGLIKWSRDSNYIFCHNGGKFGKLNLLNGQLSLPALPDFNYTGDFAVSEDEQHIAFTFIQNKTKSLGVYSLVDLQSRQLPVSGSKLGSPIWFPNGSELAYSSDQSGLFQIYKYSLRENSSTQITFNNFSSIAPIVSPDGTKIGYLLISSFNNN